MKKGLPPNPLPALPDPAYGDEVGVYAHSKLRDVCGTRINPDAVGVYKRRSRVAGRPILTKTCAHPNLENWLNDVRSFDPRCRLHQPSFEELPLSAIIPRLSIWGESLPFPVPEGATYSIDYHYLHSNPKTLPDRESSLNLKERFPDSAQLLLAFFNGRKLLASLWHPLGFWSHPFVKQFDAVIMPDFSAFNNDPTPQYLIGERQLQVVAEEAYSFGHAVIPTVAWATGESLRRQMELWTSMYPYVNTIHLDCHGSGINRTGWVWHWLFAMERYCSDFPHIRWMISGMTQGWAIRELNKIFPNKNYCLMPSVSMMVSVLSGGSRDPDWQAAQFRGKIRKLEDLRAGREVAESQPRPERWPMFSDLLLEE